MRSCKCACACVRNPVRALHLAAPCSSRWRTSRRRRRRVPPAPPTPQSLALSTSTEGPCHRPVRQGTRARASSRAELGHFQQTSHRVAAELDARCARKRRASLSFARLRVCPLSFALFLARHKRKDNLAPLK
eukprot:2406167-Pleurochrysis_carterae.AAC.1